VAKTKSVKKRSVLFVCAANQCRSPMAMVLFKNILDKRTEKREDWQVESAGIWAVSGYSATSNANLVMSEMGLDLNDHRSQPVTESLLGRFNLILCMENEHVNFIKRNFPDLKEKIFLLSEMAGQDSDIWDPAGFSLDAYKDTANEILELLKNGSSKIFQLSK
jgi:protein-tyrosine phosphatase